MKIFQSLSHAVLIGLLLLGTVLLAFSYRLSLDARQIHQEAMEDHFFMSFLNTVLEARRYEKGYLLFHKKSDWESAVGYLDQIDHQLRENREGFLVLPDGKALFARIFVLSAEYREKLLAIPALIEQDAQNVQALELALHQTGRQLISLAEKLTTDTKDDITTALRRTQHDIVMADIVLVLVLCGYGSFCIRRIVVPLNRLRDELTHVLTGRQEQIQLPGANQEFIVLTHVMNQVVQSALHRREERASAAQQAFADAVLLRLVKTLGQPMANISTTCQILLEEDAQVSAAFRNDMLMQIRQQAEQGRRILMTVQEYAIPQEEPAKPINLARLIDRVVTHLPDEQAIHVPWDRDIPMDLEVIGNPYTLELALADLISHSLQSTPSHYRGTIQGCRRNRDEMREALKKSIMRPLVWLHPDCQEVAEIALPVAGEVYITSDQDAQDVSRLCVPQEDGNPGICLLPGIIRQHGGALLAERVHDSVLLFRLWLPVAQSGGWHDISDRRSVS
ncbi:MAG: HAMP domain-containing histidine kinase [Magnetococcales bacterium]|nr:HAMP domain-containing histidine kinase [Magnetococcales bacterium]